MSVTLRPMTGPEFDEWRQAGLAMYAQEFVDSGILTPEEARTRAETDYDALLTDGLATENHLIWSADNEAGETVGSIWVALMPDRKPPHSFVYSLDVDAGHRRKGYGQAIMEAAMQECRERGIGTMGLNVFGHNETARRLYDRLGFTVASTSMKTTL
jgi:ribosomal protein S18 acetylase RimI-like enzyme